MNDEELKALWRQQTLKGPAGSAAHFIPAMQNKTAHLRRALLARDVVELLACAVVAVIFAYYFYLHHAPMMRAGSLITVAASIFVACKILYARRSTPVARPDASVVESLRAELRSVQAQSRLLKSVAWWYLLPLEAGALLFVWGSPFDRLLFGLAFKIGFTLFSLALDVAIYRLNQRAVTWQLLPLQNQLQSMLRAAESGEPLDETDAAKLRPIVLSMTAADHVKLTHFKVAFWQMALWGEVGFVGIWFFLMLSFAMDNKDWKTAPPDPAPLVQSIGPEETSRYSVLARKVVDLFNADDYASVQKLYDSGMAKLFPPQATVDFYKDLADRLGRIESFDGPARNGYRDWPAFRLHFQRGEWTMSLALDSEDKISGIYFKPSARAVNISMLMRRTFSWQHLLWLAPFFLGGLVYSWLLQKLTVKSVGISVLGIHLHRGQNLILWDEILEVRPQRILNMRSLWLVRESGEKTIMPWTSLGRHGVLKQAIESSAPANHPIRNWLRLLKRD